MSPYKCPRFYQKYRLYTKKKHLHINKCMTRDFLRLHRTRACYI